MFEGSYVALTLFPCNCMCMLVYLCVCVLANKNLTLNFPANHMMEINVKRNNREKYMTIILLQ